MFLHNKANSCRDYFIKIESEYKKLDVACANVNHNNFVKIIKKQIQNDLCVQE